MCGKVYPVTSEFYFIDKRKGFRNSSKCRDCFYAHIKEKHAQHPETLAKYRAKHQEEQRVNNPEKYLANKERDNARSKAYHEAHRELSSARCAQWKKDHPERVKASAQKSRENNKEKIKQQNKKWEANNRSAVNARERRRQSKKRALKSTLTLKQWEDIKAEFGQACAYCGKTKKLEIEHFIPLSINGELTINNVLPSCKTCNCSKSNKSFFTWYPNFKHYSKKREKKILNFLGYDNGIQQLKLE